MKLYHYSAEPLVLDPHRAYKQDRHQMKPCGLWLSAEDDGEDSRGWRDWCEGESFCLEALTYRTELAFVRPDVNVLQIDTPAALLAFTNRFNTEMDSRYSLHGIDWSAVADAYRGLIIAPYQWKLRFDTRVLWYYAWDCRVGLHLGLHARSDNRPTRIERESPWRSASMNHTILKTAQEVADVIHELADYKRPVCYNLSEIKVVQTERGFEVFYQKDKR